METVELIDLLAVIFALEDLLVDGVQSHESVLEGVLLPLKTHFSQHCNAIFSSANLLPLHRISLVLQGQLCPQSFLDGFHPA